MLWIPSNHPGSSAGQSSAVVPTYWVGGIGEYYLTGAPSGPYDIAIHA